MSKQELSSAESTKLLEVLKSRFEKNMSRHKGVSWEKVQSKLGKNPGNLWSVNEMERTGGEPDVVVLGKSNGELVFVDCAAESPKGRRSLCYDKKALESRKEYKPKDSAINMAEEMGIEVLTEDEYRELQELGEFDLKT
ncbi:DUF4256 domain-containing protein, partial [Candidatus Dojkabacteria bacterium]|nr:DUF4256 domain-containing protein [Candidatus Dojkabacteria bacterium]